MILKGSQRGGAVQLARHLLNDVDNDHIELHELRGFIAEDLAGAMKEAQAISLGTKCQQFLFSLSLSPPPGEIVSIEDFERAIGEIEAKIGLGGQPRAVIFHEKEARRHAHCVWSRIDAGLMKAINLAHFKLKLRDMSRQLFLEHGWTMPRGLAESIERDPLNYDHAEGQQAKRIKQDPKELKALFRQCWERSDSKAAFTRALKEQGFILARGDRRGFVAVDRHGEVYSISRWIGEKARTVRARLGEADDLPRVDEALALFEVEISDDTRHEAETADTDHERKLAAFAAKRDKLVDRQRQARRELGAAQAERRRQLHGPVEFDDVGMHTLAGKMAPGDIDELGGHPDAGAIAAPPHRAGSHQATAGNPQVQGLVEPLGAVLQQDILAYHAHISGAVAHIGGHIGTADNNQAHLAVGGIENQFAAAIHVIEGFDADARQQGQRLLEDPSLGKRYGQAL